MRKVKVVPEVRKTQINELRVKTYASIDLLTMPSSRLYTNANTSAREVAVALISRYLFWTNAGDFIVHRLTKLVCNSLHLSSISDDKLRMS